MSSFVERMRQRAVTSDKTQIEHARDTEVSTETKVCPGCGAGRSEAHGVAECRYCGYVFIAPLAGPTARREP
ncbi:hypothetical protein [Actinomyces howellii]|uniref:Uncharacterized protein n=1 Tax=Actinomyces howellii TaxID=52771 RepID=A0A448HHI5_9ACTO|nr:hypothetical protein [Actinomyces howellii]VEG28439.1 Uncharacterised protein [Actinomyces howellii]